MDKNELDMKKIDTNIDNVVLEDDIDRAIYTKLVEFDKQNSTNLAEKYVNRYKERKNN